MKKTALSAAICLLALPLPGQEAVTFLKIQQGPKAAAMAGAFSAVPGNVETAWYNPAGIAGIPVLHATAKYGLVHGDVLDQYFAAGYPVTKGQGLALFGDYQNVRDTYRDAAGLEGGSFGNSDLVLGLGYGLALGGLSLGLGGKYLREQVEEVFVGQGAAVDLGLIYAQTGGVWSWSFAWQNLGFAAKLGENDGERHLPGMLRMGTAWDVDHLLLTAEYRYQTEICRHSAAFGMEFQNGVLDILAGLDMERIGRGIFSGLTFGVGVDYGGMAVHYTVVPDDILGWSHSAAFSYYFTE